VSAKDSEVKAKSKPEKKSKKPVSNLMPWPIENNESEK
jgi:hypothetical protein